MPPDGCAGGIRGGDRGEFLKYVAELLQAEPSIGDGCVFRAAQRAQARFYDPPDLSDGHGKGAPGTSKYSRVNYGRQSD